MTRTVFVEPDPKQADVIFVFGSSQGDWKTVAHSRNLAPVIYIAGGVEHEHFSGKSESAVIWHTLRYYGVSREQMRLNRKYCSRNTKEDAKYGRLFFERNRIPCKRLLFVCKSFHGGRCLRTLQKFFPGSKLFPLICPFHHNGYKIGNDLREWWPQHVWSRSLVFGEYLRIRTYAERGDIASL